MENKNIQVRLCRAGAELTLNGNEEAVKSILESLTTEGLGALSEFFYENGTYDATQLPQTGDQSVIPDDDAGSGNASASIYTFKYRLEIIVPRTSAEAMQFAFDIDGDPRHRTDNLLGSFLAAMGDNIVDFHKATEQACADGRINYLLNLQTADRQLLHDGNASLTIYRGIPEMPDDNTFTVDKEIPPVVIKGTLASGHFISDDPLVTRDPHSVELMIGAPTGNHLILIPVQAARIEFDVNTDRITNGKLGGAMVQSDMSNLFIPELANTFTAIINDETSENIEIIKQMFDVGGGRSQAGDLRIDSAELTSNSIVETLLIPDLSLFDPQGNYAPNNGTGPDSFSFGCGFTALKAEF